MKQKLHYNELVRFFYRSRKKLQSLAARGKNFRKQEILKRRIARLFELLTGMQRALKIGTATAALSVGMVLFQPNAANAQSFAPPQDNPFGLLNFSNIYRPLSALVDLDNDGDQDLMVGNYYGNFYYYQNLGTGNHPPSFAAPVGDPFGLTYIAVQGLAPSFADLDNDGDKDLLAGTTISGQFLYFENTGSSTAPAFASPVENPYGLSTVGISSCPAIADIDHDGDLDLMSGELLGNFYYFQNTGTASNPVFAAPVLNPFGLSDIGPLSEYSAPAFVDLDHDGDLDLMSGDSYLNFHYYQNTGTISSPSFAASQTNPFGLIPANDGLFCGPTFGDLDNDGDMDMLSTGLTTSIFKYYMNTEFSSSTAPVPTLSEWGLITLGGLLLLVGVGFVKKIV